MSGVKVNETRLWDWLAKARKVYGKRLHVDRIENLVSSGHSDVSGTLDGKSFFMELKTSARPARRETRIRPKFQPNQVPWLEARWEAGGCASVLLQVGSDRGAMRYLLPATRARELAEKGFTEAELDMLSELDSRSAAPHILKAASTIL